VAAAAAALKARLAVLAQCYNPFPCFMSRTDDHPMFAMQRYQPQVVNDFASTLDGIEQERLQTVGDETKRLVDLLVKICHKFPQDIER